MGQDARAEKIWNKLEFILELTFSLKVTSQEAMSQEDSECPDSPPSTPYFWPLYPARYMRTGLCSLAVLSPSSFP